jgi:uncharacterized protein YfdQ (DUF2303 family)
MENERATFSDETVQSLIEAGKQLAAPKEVQTLPGNPVPFIINDGVVKPLPELIFNDHAERPERIKGTVRVFDPDSFTSYYSRFADLDSRIFADDAKRSVTAVLDYHEANDRVPRAGDAAAVIDNVTMPRWGQHRVVLEMRHSEEWSTWIGANNKQMTQQQFSEFLEQNSIDIVDPKPAAIVEIARDLSGTTEVEFGAGLRMQDGQVRFKYTEQTKTSVGADQVTVPGEFVLGIPVFVGGNPGRVRALLRYRCKEGKLTFWYTLVRPEAYVRDAFAAARDLIARNLAVTIINGVPA